MVFLVTTLLAVVPYLEIPNLLRRLCCISEALEVWRLAIVLQCDVMCVSYDEDVLSDT